MNNSSLFLNLSYWRDTYCKRIAKYLACLRATTTQTKTKQLQQAELDEIDLDLDELLDMEDDDTRRRWLKVSFTPV